MDDTAKYLIHADITANGVVERSDVVGAVFGQTEGLLGDELDLRDLQQSSKVGRIDVEIESEAGRSAGSLTIASRLDKVETAILAAGLETVDRVGPCEADLRVIDIEDVRQAKRREVVDRAKELLATAFDEDLLSSAELIEEVRESVRIERVTEYEGLPAGPRVETSDAVIVVEGRADVLTLLRYGIKNAIAVEGTNIPDAVADLTAERTVTAFLDGDRGGDLILRELDQVGDVDYVAFAPEGRSVEDLDREEVRSALREKVPFDMAVPGTPGDGDGNGAPSDDAGGARDGGEAGTPPEADADDPPDVDADAGDGASDPAEGVPSEGDPRPAATDGSATPAPDTGRPADGNPGGVPATLESHVGEVVGSGTARLLDDDLEPVAEVGADGVFEAIRDAGTVPATVVMDGTATQRILDVAAQRGVGRIIARTEGEFTKQPAGVRLLRAEDIGRGA